MTIAESYAACRKIAKERARNFYYSFGLLPKHKSDAMCAIYAFMRYCDDLSDEPGAQRASMEQWRRALDAALDGEFDGHAVWPAFHDTVQRFAIPRAYFHEMIDGVSSDLTPQRHTTEAELYRYCYQVASVVGLTIIHIFGFRDPKALELAGKCGQAFQLTNIIRDVREDADMGRVYLPGIDIGNLASCKPILRAQGARARAFYGESMPLIGMVDKDSRASLWALIEIYSRLLAKIEASDYDVLIERVRLSAPAKVLVVLQAYLG